MSDEAAQWRRLATTDLATARQLLTDGIFYAQQAAEKALKSLWIARRGEMAPKTHNLVALSTELGGSDEVVQAAAELAPEYVLTRYVTPDVASPEDSYDERSGRIHLAAADTIVNWVTGQNG